jgi:hypothetical protein
MKRMFLFAVVLGFGVQLNTTVAQAEDAAPAAAAAAAPAATPIDMTKEGPLTRLPPKKADTKNVDALYKAFAAAHKAGDVNAAAALVDFPMIWQTDDATGAHKVEMLDKDTWIKEMTSWFTTLPKETKLSMKRKIAWHSADFATVTEDNVMVMGKTKGKWASSATIIKKDGKWLFKAMSEAGWGKPAAAPAPAAE